MKQRLKYALVAAILSCSTNAMAQDTEPTSPKSSSLAALAATHPAMRVFTQSESDAPSQITGIRVDTEGESAEARALGFLRAHERALGLAGVVLEQERVESFGRRTVVHFAQKHGDLKVWERDVRVTLDDQQRVVAYTSNTSTLGRVVRGKVTETQSREAAAKAVFGEASALEFVQSPSLVVVSVPGIESYVAWRVVVIRKPLVDHLEVLVDTRDASVISTRPFIVLH